MQVAALIPIMNQPEPQSLPYEVLLGDIAKGLVKIPQFQRDFVWSREKSAALIDSILRGYPIGTFILWRTKETFRRFAISETRHCRRPRPVSMSTRSWMANSVLRACSPH